MLYFDILVWILDYIHTHTPKLWGIKWVKIYGKNRGFDANGVSSLYITLSTPQSMHICV